MRYFMKAHDVSPPKRTANNMALNSSQTELGALFLPNRQKSMKNTEMLENLTSGFRERRSNVNNIQSEITYLRTVIQNQDFNTEPKKVDLKALLYEADADGYNFPWYVESYYYDSSKRWMIYTSHDFTITFAGEKLVRTAKEIIDHKYLIK